MKLNEHCDLIIGNKPENDSDTQYHECEECHRYNICHRYYKSKMEDFEMSISEQVKELRDCVHRWQNFESVSSSEPFKLLSEAADTIEALSAKLAAVNMEQSEVYYNGKKQRSLTINIQIGKDETNSDIIQLLSEIIDETNGKGYSVMNAIVDGMDVFDYKGFSKDFFNPKE